MSYENTEYWLCCGSTEFFKHKDGCCEAQLGYPEHCRWGTADKHSKSSNKSTQITSPLSDDDLRKMMPINLRADEEDALIFARLVEFKLKEKYVSIY